MTQADRRLYLINKLIAEQQQYSGLNIPENEDEQRQLLRSLLNVRPAKQIDEPFLTIQNEYLQAELCEKGVTDYKKLTPVSEGIYLWQGDITTLKCGAIVNAANSGMTGCYYPCHRCIDNCIHTYAGLQLRLFCSEMMKQQGHEEATGTAKITPAFNLPCKYILHTVGPIVSGKLTEQDEKMLASCYLSCLELAEKNQINSVAFCCISTGEFHFPNHRAAEIAIETVKNYKSQKQSKIEVIFIVFKDEDYEIYREYLGSNKEVTR